MRGGGPQVGVVGAAGLAPAPGSRGERSGDGPAEVNAARHPIGFFFGRFTTVA